jgi:hypothetical protein
MLYREGLLPLGIKARRPNVLGDRAELAKEHLLRAQDMGEESCHNYQVERRENEKKPCQAIHPVNHCLHSFERNP